MYFCSPDKSEEAVIKKESFCGGYYYIEVTEEFVKAKEPFRDVYTLVVDGRKAHVSESLQVHIIPETYHVGWNTLDGQTWLSIWIATGLIFINSIRSFFATTPPKHITLSIFVNVFKEFLLKLWELRVFSKSLQNFFGKNYLTSTNKLAFNAGLFFWFVPFNVTEVWDLILNSCVFGTDCIHTGEKRLEK
jgi:hypothetical protein